MVAGEGNTKMQTITALTNDGYHNLIDALTGRKMYGEITLYMQAGNIETCRISERLTKKEVDALIKKEPKVITVKKAAS
jgi:hypothetical protein